MNSRTLRRKEQEVWEACDCLHEEGQRLTYEAIGNKLCELGYKRGSNSDLFKYLQQWKAAHNLLDIKPEVFNEQIHHLDSLLTKTEEHFARLESQTETLVQSYIAHMKKQIESLHQDNQQLMIQMTQLKQLLREKEASIHTLNTELALFKKIHSLNKIMELE